jgi:8-amino-7-oxononanoate synthase
MLEAELAAFKGVDAALLFGSGFACNVGVIPALAQRGDVIHSDSLNHASIVDGCRLAAAQLRIYPHVDTRALADALVESQRAVKQMIVTDAVFSMDGDVAPVPDIVRLAETHNAFVVVDDAHATGVLGASGKGSLEHFGVCSNAVVMMGTLGKALGSIGGFIAGTQDLIDYLAGSARSFLFTTALPAPAAASALTSLRILRAEPERVALLWENARLLHAGLTERGFRVATEVAAIIPVYLDDERAAVELSEMLYDSGVVVQPIGPPYVPTGTSRLRVIASAAHSGQDLEVALDAFQRVSKASVARA